MEQGSRAVRREVDYGETKKETRIRKERKPKEVDI